MNASEQIDNQIASLNDWRGGVMVKLRKLIHEADPEIVEEWKWGTGVFVKNGMVCALGVFKNHVKINFFKGAFLEDKDKLFYEGQTGKTMRSIDFFEDSVIKEEELKKLIKQAVEYNAKK